MSDKEEEEESDKEDKKTNLFLYFKIPDS